MRTIALRVDYYMLYFVCLCSLIQTTALFKNRINLDLGKPASGPYNIKLWLLKWNKKVVKKIIEQILILFWLLSLLVISTFSYDSL